MKWIGKEPPLYIFLDDIWERESDRKQFKPDTNKKGWVAEDGEAVYWAKKARIMKWREKQ
jgi:hypothetical protein